jgi:spoIIIJ-associated protein
MSVDAGAAEVGSPAEQLQDLLEEIVDALGLEARVEVHESPGELSGNVEGDGVGLLIGRRGQTIDAVQHLAQRIVFQGGPGDTRITIDADGYRARRRATLEAEADEAADEALRNAAPIEFEAMPASERRIVHEYLRNRGDVETYSEGEEPDRYLVVAPLRD